MDWLERYFGYILCAVLALCIAAVGWAGITSIIESRKPKHGVVYAKNFVPAHTSTFMMPMLVGKTTIMVPQTTHHPDEWHLHLRRPDGSVMSVSVPQSVFNETQLDSHYEMQP